MSPYNYGWVIGKYLKLGLVQSEEIISPPHSIMKIFKHTENLKDLYSKYLFA